MSFVMSRLVSHRLYVLAEAYSGFLIQLHVNQHAKQIFQERGYKVPDFDGVVMFEVESLENLDDVCPPFSRSFL
jgi:hypothetical protein